MASWFVDPSAGVDDPGTTGTVGDPYNSIQYCLDNAGVSWGDQINLKAGTADVLSASITYGSVTGTHNIDNPLIFKGYTSAENDGGIGEIDGNNAVTTIFTASAYDIYCDLKLHNCTGQVLDPGGFNTIINCEVTNGGGTFSLVDGTSNVRMIGCNVHGADGSGQDGIECGNYNAIIGCRVADVTGRGVYATATYMELIGCLIYKVDEHGIQVTADAPVIMNNTIIGDSIANMDGVSLGTGTEQAVIVGNIIKDWDGTGAYAVSFPSSSYASLLGHNNLHNNTGNYEGKTVKGCDLTANDTTTDPSFVDDSNATLTLRNYSVGADAKGDGYPSSNLLIKSGLNGDLTESHVDPGAAQREEPAGGGGTTIITPRRRKVV